MPKTLVTAMLALGMAVVTSAPAAARPAPRDAGAWCGTDRGQTRMTESLARHRRNEDRLVREFRAAAAAGGQATLAEPVVREEGGVVVVIDNGTLVFDQNAFDFASSAVKMKYFKRQGSYKLFRQSAGIGSVLGDKLPLGDDDSVQLRLAKPLLFFGVKYDEVWINSDGNLTFGKPDDASSARDLGRARNGPPRIAPFFQDLDPSAATGAAGVYARIKGKKLIVTWLDVPQFGTSDRNTFQAEIAANGQVKLRFGDNLAGKNGIVGIFPGGASALNLIDWSEDIGQTYFGAIAETFSDAVTLDEAGLANLFLQHYQDVYSHLIMFSDFLLPLGDGTIAYEYSPRNRIRGIGQPLYDSSGSYGSRGVLEAMVQMGWAENFLADLREPQFVNDVFTPLGILMHEIAHRWLLFVRLAGAGLDSEALLGRGGAHWSFYSQSHASFLEGSEIEDQGGGQFMTQRVPASYSMQDLYLMGFADADEVDDADQPFYVAGNDGLFPDANTRPPQPEALIHGTRRDYSIEDIIAAEGARVPSADDAPKQFRMALVLVTRNGEEPSVASLSRVQAFAAELEREFRRMTLRRGRVDTTPLPR